MRVRRTMGHVPGRVSSRYPSPSSETRQLRPPYQHLRSFPSLQYVRSNPWGLFNQFHKHNLILQLIINAPPINILSPKCCNLPGLNSPARSTYSPPFSKRTASRKAQPALSRASLLRAYANASSCCSRSARPSSGSRGSQYKLTESSQK